MPAGRPSEYTAELVDEFCKRVALGRATYDVCDDEDMPSKSTVYRWRHEFPEFWDKLARARDERLAADIDEMRALGRRVLVDPEIDHNRINSAVNAIDKAARLMAPKRVEISGRDGGAIKTEEVGGYDLARRIAFALASAKPASE